MTVRSRIQFLTKKQIFEGSLSHKKLRAHLMQGKLNLKVLQDISTLLELLDHFSGSSKLHSEHLTHGLPQPPTHIADVGGDQSRALPLIFNFFPSARGAIIDTFDTSIGDGTTKRPDIINTDIYECLLGSVDSKKMIPDSTFDAVFSISVAEHVPLNQLESFFHDAIRITKPGGLIIHNIDIHINDSTMNRRGEAYIAMTRRISNFCEVHFDDFRFSTTYCSNPDDIMFRWAERKPQTLPWRHDCQCSSLLIITKKS